MQIFLGYLKFDGYFLLGQFPTIFKQGGQGEEEDKFGF